MVPGRLAVGLDEVGVPARRSAHRGERVLGPGRALPLGRGQQGPLHAGRVEPVDPDVAEEPLGVGLRRRQHTRQVRQPGADQHQRLARLGQLVAGRAERRHVLRRQVLHLVDEHRHPGRHLGGQVGDVGEQLQQVDLDVARVGPADGGHAVDRRCPAVDQLAAARVGAQPERLEHRQHLGHPVRRPVPDRQLAYGGVERAGQRPAQAGVGPRLDLPGAPEPVHRLRPQRVQQHRLAHPAQPGQHQAALRPTALHPLESHVERAQLRVAPGQLGRALTGAGGVRVAHRVHVSDRINLSSADRRFA